MKTYSGVLQRFGTRMKKKGAILAFDSVNYLTVLIVLVGLGIAGFAALESYRVVTCKMELNEISSALATYQSLRVDGNSTADDLTKLLKDEAIASGEAIDGVKHGNFLKPTTRWSDSGIIDPWGHAYTADGGTNGNGGTVKSSGDALTGEISTHFGTGTSSD